MDYQAGEERARNFLHSIEVAGAGGEHKIISLSGLQQVVTPVDVSESHNIIRKRISGHHGVDPITIREAPVMGCHEQPIGNFLIECDFGGVGVAHLRRIAGIGVTWEVIDNKEGTELGIGRLAGHKTYPDITVEAVVDWDTRDQLYAYMRKVGRFTGPGDYIPTVESQCPYFEDVIVRAFTHDKRLAAKWYIHRAWVMNWTPFGDLDATADDVSLERITLALDPMPNQEAIEEDITIPFESEHMASDAWYEFVNSAYNLVPQRKDLIVHTYHPGQIPRDDQPKASYKLLDCWVSEITYQDFDANADDIMTREVTVQVSGVMPLD